MRCKRDLGALVVTVLLAATGCSSTVSETSSNDRVRQARTELMADGVSAEVADCVVRLARHDLGRQALDDITRDELIINCERAQAVIDGGADGAQVDPLAFVDGPDTLGDDSDLDRLWRLCEEGVGASCDELFERSPVGSEYEQFGVSCGNRDEILRCSELDDEEQDNHG